MSTDVVENTVTDEYAGWYGYTNQDGSDFLYLEKGTEVSKFQNENGPIDWNAAKKDGLDFVMIRLAYGTKEDAYFDANVKGAQKVGIKVGVYLCSTAKNMNDAMAEADLTLKKIKPYKLEYPVAYDLEVASMLSEGLSKDDLTDMINAYCKKVEDAGFIPMVYANRTWLTKYMNLSKISYDVWFAAYPENRVYVPVGGSKTTIWQSSEKGVVKGIKGQVTTEFSWKVYGAGIPLRKMREKVVAGRIPCPLLQALHKRHPEIRRKLLLREAETVLMVQLFPVRDPERKRQV